MNFYSSRNIFSSIYLKVCLMYINILLAVLILFCVMNLVWDPEVPIDVGSKEPLYLTMLLFVDCLEVTIGSPGDK